MTDLQRDAAAAPERIRRGRPRDTAMDEAILRAGWAVLAEAGYAGLSFEAVAERAGCSRPALYRRFGSRRDLVLALIEASAAPLEPDLAGIDDPRHELVELMSGFVQLLAPPVGAAILALAQARRGDPALNDALEDLLARKRPFYESALAAAAPGALPTACTHLLIDTLLGTVMFRVAVRDAPLTREDIEALVDQVIAAAQAQARRLAAEG